MTRLAFIYVVAYFIFLLERQSETEPAPIIPLFSMKKKCHTKTFLSMSFLGTITKTNRLEQYKFYWFSGIKLITALQ